MHISLHFSRRFWFVLPALLVFFLASFLALPYRASAEEPTPTATATATETQAPPRFFSSQLQVKPLSTPVGPIQDVQGRVVSRTGAGIDGVRVRAFARDWQAFDTTRDGGRFTFSLTSGFYAIQLVDMAAGEAELTVDGKSELQVQFNEVDRLLIALTATPTMSSPTATPTATETPSPSATPIPTSTPEPLPETIAASLAPEASPVAGASILPFLTDFDPAPLLQVFTYGIGIGGAIILAGLLLALVRRL